MYHQVIPQGPTPAPTSTVMDHTRILDCENIWPEATDCPDWPALGPNQRYDGPRGRVAAEARLERIGLHLNRGQKLHVPSASEREEAIGRFFRRGGSHWHALGITDLSPGGPLSEGDAGLIVEAAHLRGYLRKLEAQETAAKEAEERRKRTDAESRLANFNRSVIAGRSELTELAEAEARHKQRIEDERAFARCNDIRRNLRHSHFDAVQAAARLGEPAPEMPTFF